ncbi:MAG: hypothetical protein ABIR81_00135 [Ginsengibacter sp.]
MLILPVASLHYYHIHLVKIIIPAGTTTIKEIPLFVDPTTAAKFGTDYTLLQTVIYLG